MFKIKDKIIYKEPQFIMKRYGVDRLRVVERDLVNRIGFAFIILINLFMMFLSMSHSGIANVFSHWVFVTACVMGAILLFYALRLGYIEFNNTTQSVIKKRYQYKFLSARKIPYAEISHFNLNFNESATDSGELFTKYFFKLRLKDGSLVPLLNVTNDRK
ncbi:hypothetical protein [Marinicella gelatinilytica]|uniref:hypothetical protein n=1 Tax=Marinicella gelatinilytica TaxID=2996017 RepID=UPI00226100D7|nr:hypothetical protein [Marinicella gelatinilytica]MCX7545490.1 hypothetical protein [Marinicella gelatinilytica]